MPCDTPPPPPALDDLNNDGIVEELDESMYDFIDANELETLPQDDSIVTFSSHDDAVFTCNFDKSGLYVVTGSQDETAIVWNIHENTIKFECTGHRDSVIFANFSPDSKYVASADMNGFLQVFDVNTGVSVWYFDTYEYTWADWLRGSNTLLAGSVDGTCWKWSIPDGNLTMYQRDGIGTSIGAASNDDKKLAVGYSDGVMKFWDLQSDTPLGVLTGPTAFKGAVTTIKYSSDNALMIAASEDGTVKVIKMSDYKVVWTIVSCDADDHGHEDVSVETIGFCNTPSLIAVGTNCGLLGVYDISFKTKRFNVELNSAIVKIICDEVVPVVYAAVTEGVLQAYDVRTGQLLKTWSGHKAALLDLSVSRDCSLLMTCSDDHTCKIFERGIL